jgi:hypothetical protein
VLGGHYIYHYLVEPGYIKNILIQKFPGKKVIDPLPPAVRHKSPVEMLCVDGAAMGGLHTLIHQLILPGHEQRVTLRLLSTGAREMLVAAVRRPPRRVRPRLMLERAGEGRLHGRHIEGADGRACNAVLRRGEDRVEHPLLGRVVHALDLVVVKGIVARERAVEAGLQVGGPVVLEDQAAAAVLLTDAGDAGVDRLAAIHVLHRRLPEEEVGKVFGLEGADKVGLGQPDGVVLDRTQGRLYGGEDSLKRCTWKYK